jgi:type II secretory pathway component GspD/PulD (secretin)
MRRAALVVLLLALCLPSAWAAAGMRVEVYPLGLMDFELASRIAGEIVSKDGKLFPDKAGNRLIVLETDERHAELQQALRKLNVPPRHVRIQVAFEGAAAARGSSLSVGGQTTVGGVTVRGGPPTRGSSSISVSGGQMDATTSSLVQQELLVISGGKARLFVGEQVPYADWFWAWGLQQGLWAGSVQWRDVGARMVVEPYVLDRRIRLRLTPEFSYLLDGRRAATAIETMTTEVVVEDGQELDLGGLAAGNREFTTRFLTGYTHMGEKRSLGIKLRARIE